MGQHCHTEFQFLSPTRDLTQPRDSTSGEKNQGAIPKTRQNVGCISTRVFKSIVFAAIVDDPL